MKKNNHYVLSIAAVLFLIFHFSTAKCQQVTGDSKKDGPAIQWVNGTDYDFGLVADNKIITTVFEFINTGNKPLLIKGASTSCHCTVADYSQEPVIPNDSGYINVSYNTEFANGDFYKTIFVFTNISRKRIELHIKGEVAK